MTEPIIAEDRDENEPCQKGTVGCCVDHTPGPETNCEAW